MKVKYLVPVVLIAVLWMGLIAAMFMAGCTSTDKSSGDNNPLSYTRGSTEPTDYNNGVFYFNVRGEVFAGALSTWIAKHPDYKVVTVAPDDRCGYGLTCGYIVVVEDVGRCV